MKKLLFVLIALAMVTGAVAAQDLGLTVGVEFGIENVHRENDGDLMPYLMPHVIYENSFLDETLEFYGELAYIVGFFDDYPMDLFAFLELAYNIPVGDICTLTLFLGNTVDTFAISPRPNEGLGMYSAAWLGVRNNWCTPSGGFYLQGNATYSYLHYDSNDDNVLGLELTGGWDSNFGFGASVTPIWSLYPEFGFDEVIVNLTYYANFIYAGLDVVVPNFDYFDILGLTVIPEVSFNIFGNFFTYFRCRVSGLFSDHDMILAPALGVRYSF
ncbi:MAG: hypothetical protein FWG77_02590 [Treponema sp.]|nr:hypothetical protein [Treponema sp.]